MAVKSTARAAAKDPTRHSFDIHGNGYVDHGAEPTIAPGAAALPPVRPPALATEGSCHVLLAPGPNEIILRWVGGNWQHPFNPGAGNRLAWTPKHLGDAGWSYHGLVN